MSKESGTIYFIAGLMMGGLVGVGIGMLLAPEDGENTRVKVKKATKQLLDNSINAFQTFEKNTLEPTIAKVNSKIKEKVAEIEKEGLEETFNKVRRQINTKVVK